MVIIESAVNRVLDGNTYLGKKLAPSSLCKKIVVKKPTAYTWDWYCHLVGDRPLFNNHSDFYHGSKFAGKRFA